MATYCTTPMANVLNYVRYEHCCFETIIALVSQSDPNTLCVSPLLGETLAIIYDSIMYFQCENNMFIYLERRKTHTHMEHVWNLQRWKKSSDLLLN